MRAALVVGINNYPWAPLHAPVNDANAIADVLETNGGGDSNFAVKLLRAPSDTVTKPILWGAIRTLFEADCDVCLLYFSGHGIIESTGGYIVTQDAKWYDEGISMDNILALANRSQVRNRVILLDCCHSGTLGTPTIMGSNLALLSEGLSILTASRSSESALELGGKSVFTSLVVSALQGGAADLRGHVTAGSIYAYVDQALGPWHQRPMFKTSVTRFTPLRSVTPPVPSETLRKICVYFPEPQHEYRLDPSYEFTDARSISANVATMKDLDKLANVGLVVPVGEEHMYFAAVNSKSCRLTALGHQYWRMVKEKRI
jgi:hypothetical protein